MRCLPELVQRHKPASASDLNPSPRDIFMRLDPDVPETYDGARDTNDL